jgi:hypothetical protein
MVITTSYLRLQEVKQQLNNMSQKSSKFAERSDICFEMFFLIGE